MFEYDHQAGPEEIVGKEIARYGGELLPGAVETLGQVWSTLAKLSPSQRAENVAEGLNSDFGKRYRNPEHVATLPANAAPVRRVLARYASELRDGAVDELTARLGPSLNDRPVSQIARGVVEFLMSGEARGHLKNPSPPAPGVVRLRDILYRHRFNEVADVEALARDFGQEFHSTAPEAEIVRTIAKRLGMTPYLKYMYGGQPLSADDPRRTYIPRTAPTGPVPTQTVYFQRR